MARGITIFIWCLFIATPAFANPPAVIAVAGAVAAGYGGVIAGTAVAFSWASFGVSLALSALSMAFAPKAKKNNGNDLKSGASTQQFKQAVSAREIVYGEIRKSGAIVYAGTTEGNRYLHLMIVLASHEVNEIGEIIVDDYSITDDMMDAFGNVTGGRYAQNMTIKKHLGTDTQAADSMALSEISEWTSAHQLKGMAYIYIKLAWNQDIFPNGVPNFSAWIKGKQILDPRDSVTKFSTNVPLFIRDYLTDTNLGMKVSSDFIDDQTVEMSANIADEFVSVTDIPLSVLSVDATNDYIVLDTEQLDFVLGDMVHLTSGTIGGLSSSTDYYVLPYRHSKNISPEAFPSVRLCSSFENCMAGIYIDLTSGTSGELTKKSEPRYHGGGILKSDSEHGSNLSDMFPSMAGTIANAGGRWRIYAGAYRTPTVYLDENDLAGGIQVTTKISKQDRFNRIQGVYTSPINNGNPSDYPIVKNDTYAADDGEVILRTRDLAFTQRPHTAQRIAKTELERARQEISFTASFKLTAFKVLIADNFYFSFNRYGWTNKVFECVNWNLTVNGDAPVIEMTCREMASTVYDWNSGEETLVDPAPNSNLPDIFTVNPILDLLFDSVSIVTVSGDNIFNLIPHWTQSTDGFVKSKGQIEIQYKKSSEADYSPSSFVDGDAVMTQIPSVSADTSYDIRIRAINSFGVRSVWTYRYGVTTGSGGAVVTTEDWGDFSSVDTTEDWGDFSSVDTTEDWGAFA